MAAHAATSRQQLVQPARIAAAVAVLGPLIAELLHPWALRFPAIGLAVALVEFAWPVLMQLLAPPAQAGPAQIPAQSSAPPDTSPPGPGQ